MKPKLKPPGMKRWKLMCDTLLSTSAFKFNLRRYMLGGVSLILNNSAPRAALGAVNGFAGWGRADVVSHRHRQWVQFNSRNDCSTVFQ